MHRPIGIPLVSACLLLLCLLPAAASDLAVDGTWSEILSSSDLTGGPGTDFAASFESDPAQMLATVSGTAGPDASWIVTVRGSDVTWNSPVQLWVRRAGDGTGPGTITGGTSYQGLNNSDGLFFSGTGDRLSMPFQLKFTGISVQVPAGSYSANLVLTVIDQ